MAAEAPATQESGVAAEAPATQKSGVAAEACGDGAVVGCVWLVVG